MAGGPRPFSVCLSDIFLTVTLFEEIDTQGCWLTSLCHIQLVMYKTRLRVNSHVQLVQILLFSVICGINCFKICSNRKCVFFSFPCLLFGYYAHKVVHNRQSVFEWTLHRLHMFCLVVFPGTALWLILNMQLYALLCVMHTPCGGLFFPFQLINKVCILFSSS